ncbi:MAG TPA: protein kinase, partial [Atopostipes sp.]|nr:protein kinase [Atopostipes sp.]
MKTGTRISDRYKIIGKIGSGGMANVYLAQDLILERQVAVKMMSLTFNEDEESDNLRRFQREALSSTELIHPNIVNIYDVGEGERPYIVMEYVEGTDLKKYIQENHPIPYSKVIKIMSQILSGISYAHRNGVIHRDIKPHNILIDK